MAVLAGGSDYASVEHSTCGICDDRERRRECSEKSAVIVEHCAVTDAMRFGIVRMNADVHTGRVRTNVRASPFERRIEHDPRPCLHHTLVDNGRFKWAALVVVKEGWLTLRA